MSDVNSKEEHEEPTNCLQINLKLLLTFFYLGRVPSSLYGSEKEAPGRPKDRLVSDTGVARLEVTNV